VEIGRQVRLLCPWARHLTDYLYLWMVRLVVTGGGVTRRPKRSLRCLLVELPWQIIEYLRLTYYDVRNGGELFAILLDLAGLRLKLLTSRKWKQTYYHSTTKVVPIYLLLPNARLSGHWLTPSLFMGETPYANYRFDDLGKKCTKIARLKPCFQQLEAWFCRNEDSFINIENTKMHLWHFFPFYVLFQPHSQPISAIYI